MPAVYYSTLSFTYTYKYDDDIVYFAHSVPYTYSTLTHYLSKLNQHQQQNKFYKVESLTTTIIGNKVFCVSISDKINEPISQNLDKKEVIICSRVHPGETNASWIMKGMLDFLLSDHEIAVELRKKYIFRMIPMLNPDGVRYGNYRCCLFGNDLNRKWKRALDYIHSPIHSVKKLIQKLQERDIQESSNDLKTTKQSENEGQNKKSQGKVELLCDIHGHSKFMGAFIYGCQYRLEDEATKANQKELNNIIRVLPYLYSQRKQYFSYEKCCFAIQKDKLGTARVVGFQELKIPKSYTLECSFLGFKNPQITNQQEDGQSNLLEMNVQDFEEVGREFLITLYMNQNQEITNQIIDLFNFKDQQIQNSQVLLEDLQKKLSEFKLSEMKPPQFLKTGFNYKLNEKLNINNITNHIKKEHQNLENKQVISEENQAKNQASSGTSTFQNTVTLPYITPIQRKVSREHAYERNQEEETILENLTKRLRYQLKSQKSQEYNFQSIKFQEPDSIQLNNKNQNFESNSNNHSEYNLLNKKNINQEFQKNPVLNFTSEGIKNSNICQQFGKLQKSNQNKPQKFSFKDYNLEKIQMSVI